MVKYDDASWHYGGDFPSDLPDEAGGTHAAMFLCWALHTNLGGELHTTLFKQSLDLLLVRKITPGAYFFNHCDGKLTDEDFNQEGNIFAQSYFDFEKGKYLQDYENIVGKNLKSLYHVPDNWDTFDLLNPKINSRYEKWKTKTR